MLLSTFVCGMLVSFSPVIIWRQPSYVSTWTNGI